MVIVIVGPLDGEAVSDGWTVSMVVVVAVLAGWFEGALDGVKGIRLAEVAVVEEAEDGVEDVDIRIGNVEVVGVAVIVVILIRVFDERDCDAASSLSRSEYSI